MKKWLLTLLLLAAFWMRVPAQKGCEAWVLVEKNLFYPVVLASIVQSNGYYSWKIYRETSFQNYQYKGYGCKKFEEAKAKVMFHILGSRNI